MRVVAFLILGASLLSSVRASVDGARDAHANRPVPRRSLLLTLARPDLPPPASPSRREHELESALDEEDSRSLDSLVASPAAACLGPLSPTLDAPPLDGPDSPSSTRQRPFRLRC